MCCKLNYDGLGSILGVSQTLGLGVRKSLTHKKFHLLLFLPLFSFYTGNNTDNSDCMSLIMALQRGNKLYQTIRYSFKRYKQSLNNVQQFTLNCIFVLLFINFALWLLALLITCDDIYKNPGRDSVKSLIPAHRSNSLFESLISHLSIMHLNMHLPKMDMIKAEAQIYDVLVFLRAGENLKFKIIVYLLKFLCRLTEQTNVIARGGCVIVRVRDSFFMQTST